MLTLEAPFDSAGTRCAGTLYLPSPTGRPPVVLLAHGLAAERRFGLHAFAERFVARGLAAFVFDYRSFGDSEGEPRALVSPRRHVADWHAAVAFMRQHPRVDGERLALWGTSLGGGHVLTVGAANHAVRAIVAQVPFVDGIASALQLSLADQLRGTLHGLWDLACAAVGAAPHRVPVVAAPGHFALMNSAESEPGYRSMIPPGVDWPNAVPARALLTLPGYRPIRSVARIRCPVLLISAEYDSLIPIVAVERTARRIREVTHIRMPVGHFDLYSGPGFETAVVAEADFLERILTTPALERVPPQPMRSRRAVARSVAGED